MLPPPKKKRRVNQQVQNQIILFGIKSLQMSNEPFSSLIISLLIIWLIRRWMFLEVEFRRVEEWMGWFDWMRGWLCIGRRFSRACMRAPVLGVLFFCCHKCHSGWGWKCFIIPKTMCRFIENNVSFYWKHRVVLLKTTCRFTENNVSFYWKHRIVLWKTTCCFGLEDEKLFWGWYFEDFWGWSSSVKVWQCGMLFLKSM